MEDVSKNPKDSSQISQELIVKPLASESLGVRSLAVLVQTPDLTILIDPGVALGFRDGYHPHPKEYEVLQRLRDKINSAAQQSNLIIVSHYHHDHFMPFYQNYAYFWSNRADAIKLYQQRRVWCKDIRKQINYSQQNRGYNFVRAVRNIAQEVVYADGRAVKVEKTIIRFSPAVPHGEEGTKLGWVIMTSIRFGESTMVHASDVQGPILAETADWILKQNPTMLILAGPPSYLVPDRVNPEALEKAAKNLKQLVSMIPTTVIDHHLLRDAEWKTWLAPIQDVAKDHSHQLLTVAEVQKIKIQQLEAQRTQLYEKKLPSEAYEQWVKQIQKSRIKTPPPL